MSDSPPAPLPPGATTLDVRRSSLLREGYELHAGDVVVGRLALMDHGATTFAVAGDARRLLRTTGRAYDPTIVDDTGQPVGHVNAGGWTTRVTLGQTTYDIVKHPGLRPVWRLELNGAVLLEARRAHLATGETITIADPSTSSPDLLLLALFLTHAVVENLNAASTAHPPAQQVGAP